MQRGAANDELVASFKAMCIDLGVNYAQFNDSYFLQPFNVKDSSKSAVSQETPSR